jgi:hypothetical protein
MITNHLSEAQQEEHSIRHVLWISSAPKAFARHRRPEILERHVGFDGFTFKIIQKISNIFPKDRENVTYGPPGWLGT